MRNIAFVDPTPSVGVADLSDRERVRWESSAMRAAATKGLLLFWLADQKEALPPRGQFVRPYGQISRLELGIWLARRDACPALNVIVGVEASIPGYEYLMEHLAASALAPVSRDLKELVLTAKELLSVGRGKGVAG
jgi:hypothetical protein